MAAETFKHRAENVVGKAKEAIGEATEDEKLREEGKQEQAEAGLKESGDKLGDAARKGKNAVKDRFRK